MSDIFISYAREDLEHARRLAEALEAQGWSVWWDRTIPAGKSFTEVIEAAIAEARCVVVMWSKSSVKSDWVREEAEEGKKRKILVPVLLDRVTPPMGFRSLQAEDLTNWDGSQSSRTLLKLVDDISLILGPPPIREGADRAGEEEAAPTEVGREKVEEEPPRPPEVSEAGKELEAPVERVATRIPQRIYIALAIVVGVGILVLVGKWYSSYQPLEETFTNAIGMKFVLIQPGPFMMGSGISAQKVTAKYGGKVEYYEHEHPQHKVKISKPFYMQVTEVTQGQWKSVIGDNPSKYEDCGDDCPVENVSWEDVQRFIGALNQKEGTNKYRLPTEAEWEYACRARSTTAFSFGDEVTKLGEYAWYGDNSEDRTHPVGQKKPNAWGLYDMHGNVWEWCQDWYGEYTISDVSEPKGPPSGEYRVLRGGSLDLEWSMRCAGRYGLGPSGWNWSIGFRVVLSPS